MAQVHAEFRALPGCHERGLLDVLCAVALRVCGMGCAGWCGGGRVDGYANRTLLMQLIIREVLNMKIHKHKHNHITYDRLSRWPFSVSGRC